MLMDVMRGLRFTIVSMAMVGMYHVALWGIGRVAFPVEAEGSLVRRSDGVVVGSRLIAQRFTATRYFQPRPSGVDYNAASTGGTNDGPSNPDHLAAVRSRLEAFAAREGVAAAAVPSEMVTASGAGLDPHIPPAGAVVQARRVAEARRVPIERVEALIRAHTEGPVFGVFGRPRVNVLQLNLALDDTFGRSVDGR